MTFTPIAKRDVQYLVDLEHDCSRTRIRATRATRTRTRATEKVRSSAEQAKALKRKEQKRADKALTKARTFRTRCD